MAVHLDRYDEAVHRTSSPPFGFNDSGCVMFSGKLSVGSPVIKPRKEPCHRCVNFIKNIADCTADIGLGFVREPAVRSHSSLAP